MCELIRHMKHVTILRDPQRDLRGLGVAVVAIAIESRFQKAKLVSSDQHWKRSCPEYWMSESLVASMALSFHSKTRWASAALRLGQKVKVRMSQRIQFHYVRRRGLQASRQSQSNLQSQRYSCPENWSFQMSRTQSRRVQMSERRLPQRRKCLCPLRRRQKR